MKKPSFKALIYVQQFLGDCMPIYPLYALMFAERSGLTNSEISLLFLGWVIVAMLAEVPTGIIADRVSRKAALIASYALQGSAFLVWLALPSFWGYALGFLAWGVGYAFFSGTFQAYLYEELKAQGDTKSFNRIFARSQSLKLVGMVVAYILAVVVGAQNYTLLLWLSAIIAITSAALIVLFPYKSKRAKAADKPKSHVQVLRSALREVRRSNKTFAYVLALGILTGIVGSMEEYTPLFYSDIGFSTQVIPLLLAGGLILSSLVGWFAHHMARLRFASVALFVVIAGLIMYAATFGVAIGLIGMLLFMRLIMLAQTLYSASLQHTIGDEQRATVGSLASFGGEILSLVILSFSAVLFAHTDTLDTYRVLAIFFTLLGLILALAGRSKRWRVDTPTTSDALPAPGRPV